jgi:hypothetical protein
MGWIVGALAHLGPVELFTPNGVPIEAAPSKHPIAHGFFVYGIEPGGNRIESHRRTDQSSVQFRRFSGSPEWGDAERCGGWQASRVLLLQLSSAAPAPRRSAGGGGAPPTSGAG